VTTLATSIEAAPLVLLLVELTAMPNFLLYQCGVLIEGRIHLLKQAIYVPIYTIFDYY
jgi:hypothetical protein